MFQIIPFNRGIDHHGRVKIRGLILQEIAKVPLSTDQTSKNETKFYY